MNTFVRAWLIVVLLVALMLINFLDKVVLGMVASPLMSELGLTPTQFGFLGGSFFWLFAVSGVVLGLTANRVSAKKLLLWMALAWSVLQLPIYFSSSLGVLVICRVLLGAGEGPAWAIAVHTIYNWFPNERRALPVGVLAQGAMAGLLLAGALIPPITVMHGWRTNFLLLGLVGLAWAALWLCLGNDGPGVAHSAPAARKESLERIPYRYLLLNRTVLSTIAMHFAFYWSFALVLTWLPSYLNKGLGFAPITAGRLFSGFVIVNVPVNLVLCWLAQDLSRRGFSSRASRGLFTAIAFVVGGALMFVPWLTSVTALAKIVALAVAFGAVTTVVSLGPAMLSDVCPPAQRAGLIAIDTAIASVAGALAPLMMGGMIQQLSRSSGLAHAYETGFALAGALLLTGGALGLFCATPEASARKIRAVMAERECVRRGGIAEDLQS
ncbi:MFS transporter [Paraburkholderia tagetis]|uniref:MFS transporter n=1 Tax=Paraburkholderia tagetis TaxID=2913261 RepID=A0A9X1RN92_9BURK|nr:MFS transporter [Paraburkholderia tagetis]MCG5073244.1 MFS transporter [Paraburkholderia tagetis]